MTDTLHVYLDNADQYRWSYLASNGPKISDSGQGYEDRRDALHGFTILNRVDPGRVPLHEVEECPRHEDHTCWVWEIPRITFELVDLHLAHDQARTRGEAWLRLGTGPDDQVVGQAVDVRANQITVTKLDGPV